MLKILFTSGGNPGMEALWRLYDGIYELHFADAILDAINPVVPAKNRHKIPFAGEAKFLKTVSEFLNSVYNEIYKSTINANICCIKIFFNNFFLIFIHYLILYNTYWSRMNCYLKAQHEFLVLRFFHF